MGSVEAEGRVSRLYDIPSKGNSDIVKDRG